MVDGAEATTSEARLWRALRTRYPGWVREYSTGRYRLDFYCPAARFAVEVDGSSHAGHVPTARDFERDKWHQDQGITTLRFTVGQVMRQRRTVLWTIDHALELRGFRVDWRTRRRHRKDVKAGAVYTGPALERVVDAHDRPLEVRDQRLADGLRRYGRPSGGPGR
jgi:very-short-patch-repair endonuclease